MQEGLGSISTFFDKVWIFKSAHPIPKNTYHSFWNASISTFIFYWISCNLIVMSCPECWKFGGIQMYVVVVILLCCVFSSQTSRISLWAICDYCLFCHFEILRTRSKNLCRCLNWGRSYTNKSFFLLASYKKKKRGDRKQISYLTSCAERETEKNNYEFHICSFFRAIEELL